MQDIHDHLNKIVRPAMRDYVAAEEALDAAHRSKDAGAIDVARDGVIRTARIAATELNHLTDFVLNNPPPGRMFADIADVRKAIRDVCVFARETVSAADTELIRDAADAFKHFKLDQRKSATVSGAGAIVSIENGYGEMRYNEQKWSGVEQVTIRTKDGNKYSMLWVLQNSYDAWMKMLGEPDKPFGQY